MTKTKEKYRQERLDPRWQKKRLEIMQRDGFECRDCSDGKETLNVHHAYYIPGRKPWEYPSWALSTTWETEMGWLLEDAPPDSADFFWHTAAEILRRYKAPELYKKIEVFVRGLTEQAEAEK